MPLTLVKPRQNRSPNYRVRGTVQGKYVDETTGTHIRERAEEYRAKREAELYQEAVYGRRVTATFEEAAMAYMENGGSPRFLGSADPETGRFDGLLGKFGPDKLASISQDDLDRVARELYPNASADTRNRQVYTPFIAVWRDAASRQLCEPRAWRRPRKPKGTRVRVEKRRAGSFPVPYDRAAEFVTAMPPLDAINMTVLFYTGMRPIEWFSVERRDVDIKGRWITLHSSKTGEPRGVPMAEILVPIFGALTDTFDGLLANYWNKRARRIEPYPITENAGGQMAGAVDFARRRTGIRDVSPYTARHSASTYLVAAGVHPFIKDQILGHAATDMSRRYTNLPQPELIEAINKLPTPDAWRTAELVENPWSILRNVVEWSVYKGDRRKLRRPW